MKNLSVYHILAIIMIILSLVNIGKQATMTLQLIQLSILYLILHNTQKK